MKKEGSLVRTQVGTEQHYEDDGEPHVSIPIN